MWLPEIIGGLLKSLDGECGRSDARQHLCQRDILMPLDHSSTLILSPRKTSCVNYGNNVLCLLTPSWGVWQTSGGRVESQFREFGPWFYPCGTAFLSEWPTLSPLLLGFDDYSLSLSIQAHNCNSSVAAGPGFLYFCFAYSYAAHHFVLSM